MKTYYKYFLICSDETKVGKHSETGVRSLGVTIFKTDEDANVVSVICLSETSDEAIPEEDDSEGDESSENSPDDTPNNSSDAGDA